MGGEKQGYFGSTEGHVLLFEYIIQLGICHTRLQISNIDTIVIAKTQVPVVPTEIETECVTCSRYKMRLKRDGNEWDDRYIHLTH